MDLAKVSSLVCGEEEEEEGKEGGQAICNRAWDRSFMYYLAKRRCYDMSFIYDNRSFLSFRFKKNRADARGM